MSAFVQAQDALGKLEKEYNNASDNTTEQLNIAPKYATALFFHNLKPKSYQILANNISIATKLAEGKYATILYAVQAMNYRLDNKEAESSKSLEMGKAYSLKQIVTRQKDIWNMQEVGFSPVITKLLMPWLLT